MFGHGHEPFFPRNLSKKPKFSLRTGSYTGVNDPPLRGVGRHRSPRSRYAQPVRGLTAPGPVRPLDAAKAPEGASTRSLPLLRFPASGSFSE